MKIDGKSLGEIFAEMPFSQRFVVIIGTAFILFTICYIFYLFVLFEPPKRAPEIVSLPKASNIVGMFDPSLTGNESSKLLAYTVAIPEAGGLYSTEVRTAVGSPRCTSWTEATGKLEARPETLMGPDLITPVTSGIWRAETPSIVYDPADIGKEWKLFAYRYFWANNSSLARLYGAIVMRTSSSATASEWSREEWLFSAAPNTPPPPYGNLVKMHLNKLHPDLTNVYFYARPSVVMVGNVMVMSLSAFVQGKDTVDRIVMIASADHGRSWRYLGTPIKDADLAAMGGGLNRINGGSLFMKDQILYLSVALGNSLTDSAGAYILDFENATKAKLRRDPKTSSLIVHAHIPTIKQPASRLGGGAIAFNETCKGKVFMSESADGTNYNIYVLPQSPLPQ